MNRHKYMIIEVKLESKVATHNIRINSNMVACKMREVIIGSVSSSMVYS